MACLRSLLLVIVAAAALIGALPAAAEEWTPFDPAAFAEAPKAGKPSWTDVFAAWCASCRAQNPILGPPHQDAKYKCLAVFKVDFDTQKDALRALNAQSQSTLIVFSGETEKGRAVGDTDKDSITALLDQAL